jgi:hypothetical protein
VEFCLMNNYYFTKYGSIIGGILWKINKGY